LKGDKLLENRNLLRRQILSNVPRRPKEVLENKKLFLKIVKFFSLFFRTNINFPNKYNKGYNIHKG